MKAASAFLFFVILGLVAFVSFFRWVESVCHEPRASPSLESEYRAKNDSKTTEQHHGGTDADQHHSNRSFSIVKAAFAETKKREANQNANTPYWEPSGWWKKFFCDAKITDVVLAFFTYCLIVVGGFQARYLYGTVVATRIAANHIPMVERGYIFIKITGQNFVEILSHAGITDPTAKLREAVVEYVFWNHGKTPAILKTLSRDIIIAPQFPDWVEYLLADMPTTNRIVGSDKSTDPPWRCTDTRATVKNANDVIRRHSYFWFYGRVVYDDIFGTEHEHRFIYRFSPTRGWEPFSHPEYSKNT
jgi:hypothetical protein